MTGQILFADETMAVPRDLVVIFWCGVCFRLAQYRGDDYIKMRAAAHREGWRQRVHNWFCISHVPTGKEDSTDA